MKQFKSTRLLIISRLLKGLAFTLLSNFIQVASAQEQSAVKALTGKNLTQLSGLDAFDLTMGGWATAGYTYNPLHPADRSNGVVQFNNRANEFTLHQLDLFIEKPLNRSAQNWQLGGRFEFMFGTDAPKCVFQKVSG